MHIGIHEYVPIVFDEEHCSLVNITFHSLLSGKQYDKTAFICIFPDFRFRVSPSDLNIQLKENSYENNESQRNSYIQSKQNGTQPKTFKEFLDKVSCNCKCSLKNLKKLEKLR